jgi:hypothetical protein
MSVMTFGTFKGQARREGPTGALEHSWGWASRPKASSAVGINKAK